ncbi:MAG: hypothetical protein KatS3mg087_0147 [Patescibacteria group bacterium]|nr:MAG: hypothetical protein KatS3mg087_0147 [Patescibacteria group bacterium]
MYVAMKQKSLQDLHHILKKTSQNKIARLETKDEEDTSKDTSSSWSRYLLPIFVTAYLTRVLLRNNMDTLEQAGIDFSGTEPWMGAGAGLGGLLGALLTKKRLRGALHGAVLGLALGGLGGALAKEPVVPHGITTLNV